MKVLHTHQLKGMPIGEQEYELDENSPVGIILRSTRTIVSTNDRGTVETWTRCDETFTD